MQQRALVEALAGVVLCDHACTVDHAAHNLVHLLALHVKPLDELIQADGVVTRGERKKKRPQTSFFDPNFEHGLDDFVILGRHLVPNTQVDDTF